MTSTVPLPGGVMTVSCASPPMVNAASVLPSALSKRTDDAEANPEPVTTTSSPPSLSVATPGTTLVTVGTPAVASIVNLSAALTAEVPPGVTTVTSTRPAPGGA